MGMVDGIEDLGKVVEGLVEGREDPSHAPEGLTGKLGKAIKGAAGSEILDAGQILIGGMRLTTGSGDPAQGQQFGQGSHRFNAAGDTVKSAFATDDWQGAGADAYGAANRDQAGRTADARRQKTELDKMQKAPEGEFTEFLKKLGEKPPEK